MDDARAHGEQLLRQAVDAYEANDLAGCLRVSEAAEALFTELGDRPRVLAARQRQAMVWAMTGDLGRAITTNRLLVAHYTELGDEISAAKCATNLAYNHRLLGRLDEAVAAYQDALRIFGRHPDRAFEVAVTHMNIATVLRSTGRFPRVYGHARRGWRLFAALPDRQMRVIDCLLLVVRALEGMGRDVEAEQARQEAEKTAERIGSTLKLGSIRHNRGSSLARRGHLAEANAEERAALRLLSQSPDLNLHLIQELSRNIARLYARTGAPRAAEPFALLAAHLVGRTLSGLTTTETRAEWRGRQAEIFDLACSLAAERHAWAELAVLVETARAQQPLADAAPPDALLPGDAGTAASLPLAPMPRFTLDGAAVDLRRAVEAVLADLTGPDRGDRGEPGVLRSLAADDADAATVDLRELADRLCGGQPALWGTLLLRATLYWYVIDESGTHGGAIDAADGTPAARALQELTAALPDPETLPERIRTGRNVMTAGAGARLAQELVPPPVRRMCQDGATRRLIFVPAAALGGRPLGALHPVPGGEPLAARLRLVHLPSPALAAGLLRDRPAPPAGVRRVGLVVADPTGDLPGGRRLVDPATPSLVGSAATRAAVSARLRRLEQPTTFVYTGHTTAAADVSRSALRLADAELAAATWLSSGGRAHFPMPATVVLLSCSSSGLGAPDWYGLATAALAAGASTVVCSLWPYLDRMSLLDREIVAAVSAGGDAVAAVHEVLDRHRARPEPSIAGSPFVWANYALITVEPPPGPTASPVRCTP